MATVFIVFASGHVDAAIFNFLCRAKNLDLIGYSRETDGVLCLITEEKPKVVIVDVRGSSESEAAIVGKLWESAITSNIIAIVDTETTRLPEERFMDSMIHWFRFPEDEEELCAVLARFGATISQD